MNNFIRVEDVENKSSFIAIGEDSGFFNINDFSDNNRTTTGAHEIGHGFGLTHPTNPNGGVDVRGQGQPGVMVLRNSLVDSPYQIDLKAKPDSHSNGMVDPKKEGDLERY